MGDGSDGERSLLTASVGVCTTRTRVGGTEMELGESETKPAVEQGAMGDRFDTATVLTLTAAHTAHDIYSAFLSPLLPVLISRLGIGLAAAGALPSVFKLGSLAQPFLGVWADRSDTRWFVIATPTVTALCMSMLGLAPNYLSVVVLLAMAGMSHAAFHPAAASTVTQASGRTWGRGTSLYMTGGKLGFAIGPLFIVSIVTWLGPNMTHVAALPGFVFSVMLYLQIKKSSSRPVRAASAAGIWKAIKEQRRSLLLLSGFVLFRSTTTVSFSTFYPTFLTGQGSSLMFAGLSVTVYQLAGAAGALAGGTLSDLGGRRAMLVVSQLLVGPFLFLALSQPEGVEGLVMLALGGAMAASATPVQLALFQELLPGSRSTAAGIFSLLSFEGSLATALVVGAVADWVGLGVALGFSVFASMVSIPFIVAVPEPKKPGQ